MKNIESATDLLNELPGFGSSFERPALGKTIWRFEQLRAGQVYTSAMFNTRKEAEDFAGEMTRMEPDLLCRVEPIEARTIWN